MTKKPGLKLGAAGSLSAMLAAKPDGTPAGRPLELNITDIDEDPAQPRRNDNPGFSAESIAEIGTTIKERGVKTPISVRENPDAPGRYIINHGARRYRGSIWAQKTVIPAYVDNDYNEEDQVIENLQRNDLTAREVADFIGRELAKGRKRIDIAKGIGKSPAFISQHAALLDLPDPIAEAFNAGYVSDITIVSDLIRLYKQEPDCVTEWLAVGQEVTRGTVSVLKDLVANKKLRRGPGDEATEEAEGTWSPDDVRAGAAPAVGAAGGPEAPDSLGASARDEGDDEQEGGTGELFPEPATVAPQAVPTVKRQEGGEAAHDPSKMKTAIVCVFYDERPARLVLNRRPSTEGLGWIKYDDDGGEEEVALDLVKVSHLVES